jgi:hypothetical protein
MTLSADLNTIQVNGVEYVRKDSVSSASVPTGNREVVVIDRGWIFAGDVVRDEATGDLTIYNAIHVFRWEEIGYTGVLENPASKKVTLKTCAYPVKVPAGSVIFTNPVSADWAI